MKILITGINGFAGSHLSAYLQGIAEIEVAGLDLFAAQSDFGKPGISSVHCCDLSDAEKVTQVLRHERPDAVVHLAARAQVAGAWDNATGIMETNTVCTQILMQAIHEVSPRARLLLTSSSEVYGRVSPGELPLTEQAPLRPNNPYATSKAAQEFVGLQYYEAFGAEIVVARPFNHIGPRQSGNFVVAAFAKQIAEIEAGVHEPVLSVGNLDSYRDFTDVRDIVRAYYLILSHGRAGERYNVCSGRSHKISKILSILLEQSEVQPKIEPIAELMRPSDTPDVVGDSSKLRSLGEWEPSISLERSLIDTLNYWREQVKGAGS